MENQEQTQAPQQPQAETPKHVMLPTEVLNRIMVFLGTQPYSTVRLLVEAVEANVKGINLVQAPAPEASETEPKA